jgi:hypothetical protein
VHEKPVHGTVRVIGLKAKGRSAGNGIADDQVAAAVNHQNTETMQLSLARIPSPPLLTAWHCFPWCSG